MKPDEYYQKQIDHYTARLKQIKKRRQSDYIGQIAHFRLYDLFDLPPDQP